MYKSIYKQIFTHTCIEFDSMHFGAGCLGRMWPYPKLWQIFSVDFRGIFFYFRYIGVSSYCSHGTIVFTLINNVIRHYLRVGSRNSNQTKPLCSSKSKALSSLKQYKRTRHSLCLLTINVICRKQLNFTPLFLTAY